LRRTYAFLRFAVVAQHRKGVGQFMLVTGHAQHEAWLERAVPPVEQLREDLWSIPVPIPASPLRYVNVYVLVENDSAVLIDAGWDDDEAWSALLAGLDTIGLSIDRVTGVLVTHIHFDHIGLAKRVAEASGCWIALHRADADILTRDIGRHARTVLADEQAFLRSLGAPYAESIEVAGTAEEMAKFVSAALADRVLEDRDVLTVGRYSLLAVHTPGHTPGHLTFLDRNTGLLFSGDHLLPRITPNISIGRLWAGNPVGDYLDSLHTVAELDVQEVLPAHEWRFRGHAARAAAIAEHHHLRSAELLHAVRRRPGATPWELAAELTWSRPWDQYSGRMRVSAVTETAAHLAHLVATGRIVRPPGDVATYLAARDPERSGR
jgi:glyoxylase-like metal-dependent hydrolase (beta-lactamase superfamily II)